MTENNFTHVGVVITDYDNYVFPLREDGDSYVDYTGIRFNKKTGKSDKNMCLKPKSVKPFPRNIRRFLAK